MGQAISRHIRRLGFSTESEYQDWCALNGFSRSLHKEQDDQQAELLASLTSGPAWRKFNRTPLCPRPLYTLKGHTDQEVVESILSGELAYGPASDRRFSPLCLGVERLKSENFRHSLAAFRELIRALGSRGSKLHLYARRVQARLPYRTCTFGEALALSDTRALPW